MVKNGTPCSTHAAAVKNMLKIAIKRFIIMTNKTIYRFINLIKYL